MNLGTQLLAGLLQFTLRFTLVVVVVMVVVVVRMRMHVLRVVLVTVALGIGTADVGSGKLGHDLLDLHWKKKKKVCFLSSR